MFRRSGFRAMLLRLRRDRRLIPPESLLYDGTTTAAQFIALGDGFFQSVLLARAHLQPTATVLDLGCGNGSIARPLTRYLRRPGRYEGIDVNADSIAWLRQRYANIPHFAFSHANVANGWYNPGGKTSPEHFTFPFESSTFDCVLVKSVFTHMLPADLPPYMREISRVLKKGGCSVITYFLLNEESRRLIEQGLDAFQLNRTPATDPSYRIAKPDAPEFVVAHDEGRVRNYYAETRCRILDLTFGDWCGRASSLGHQDLVIAAKT
jgi:ubiquinone/menaquinone biosynthesis C-methylase UbiE